MKFTKEEGEKKCMCVCVWVWGGGEAVGIGWREGISDNGEEGGSLGGPDTQ